MLMSRVINYRDMLYPQYQRTFEKYIPLSLWKELQARAAKYLKEKKDTADEGVLMHWERIVNGEVPFGYTVLEDEELEEYWDGYLNKNCKFTTEKKTVSNEYCTNPNHKEMYLDEGRSLADWRCPICGKKVDDH